MVNFDFVQSARDRLAAFKRQRTVGVEAVCWLSVWLVTSPLVISLIKVVTSDDSLNFPHPWMQVGFVNLGVWFFCIVLRYLPGFLQETDGSANVPAIYAALLGLIQGIEVGIGADILYRISITLRTEINMLCPALMLVGGLLCGLEPLDPRVMLSVSVVTVGGCLASYGTMTWEGVHLIPLALMTSVLSTIRYLLTQKWLSPLGERKPSPVALARKMSPMTAFVGFFVAALRDPASYTNLAQLPHPHQLAALLIAISFFVTVLMVGELRVVQLTSALLLSFLVPFHNVTVILLDDAIKGRKISALNWVGILMCAGATGFYSIYTNARKEKENMATRDRPLPTYQSTEPPTQGAGAR